MSGRSMQRTACLAEVPVRCVRFADGKVGFFAGSDDFQLRIFKYASIVLTLPFQALP